MIRGHSRRFWWLSSVGLAAAMALAAWFLAISPQLSAAGDARDDADALTLQNQVLRSSITALQQVDEEQLRTSLTSAVAALPPTAALPTFTRQLTELATASGIEVDSITIGAASSASGADGTATADGSTASGTIESVPVTVTTNGMGNDQRAFLTAVQVDGARRALVTGSSLSPTGGDDGTIAGRSSMVTSLTVFVAPLDSTAQTQLEKLLSGTSAS